MLKGCFTFFYSLCGPFLDLETVVSTKIFLNSFGCSNFNYQFNYDLVFDFRFSFLLNSTIIGLEDIFSCFFLGLNLRMEIPLLNVRLRKSFLKNDNFLLAFSLGFSLDNVSYPIINFGNNLGIFKKILTGHFEFLNFFLLKDFISLKFFNFKFMLYDNFTFFLGNSVISRFDSNFFLGSFSSFFFIIHWIIFKLIAIV